MGVADFKAKAVGLYGRGVLSKSALRDDNDVFDQLLGGGRYKTALEIGTYRGVTTAYLAHLCDRVITVDLKRGRMERRGVAFDRHEFWDRLGVLHKIEPLLLDAPAHIWRALAGVHFDFAFIDGDHDRPARDFAITRRCGAVLLHDYHPDNAVGALVESLPAGEVQIMAENFAFWECQ